MINVNKAGEGAKVSANLPGSHLALQLLVLTNNVGLNLTDIVGYYTNIVGKSLVASP